MTKNPILNALAAIVYIITIASVMFYGIENAAPIKSVIGPIVIVSLFTLSAAVMGYIFFYQPLQLYLDGKKKDAVNLFLQTVAVFAGITALILFLFLSGILS
jgi:hypothetical protein